MRASAAVRRVLLTADTAGGVWTYAVELARALDGRGIDVVLATMGALPGDGQRRMLDGLSRTSLHTSEFALEWMPEPWRDVDAAGEWLLDLARRTRPDIVHLSSMCHGALPWPAPVVVVAHSCVLSWWQAVRHEPAPPCFDEYRRRVALGLRAADVVLAPTTAMLREATRLYGPFSRTGVVYNARTAGSRAADEPARAKEPFVFGAGRVWDEAKNLRTLDAAACDVAWPVRIAGDLQGPDGAATLEAAEWLGVLPAGEMARTFARASIYALPARYEPFGLSALEAALAECALVLGDIASLREIWTGAALFVPPDDRGALVHALNELIAQPALCRQIGRAAAARAREHTTRAMAAQYLGWYRLARASRAA